MSHRDDVTRAYKNADCCEVVQRTLFYVAIIISICILFCDRIPSCDPSSNIKHWTYALFLVVSIGHSVAAFVGAKVFLFRGDTRRLKQFLTDSLGATLTADRTDGYYNNPFPPGLERLAANVMENALHSKETLFAENVRRGSVVVVLIGFWLAFVFAGKVDAILMWAGGVIFSTEIVWTLVRSLILRHRCEVTHNAIFDMFSLIRTSGMLNYAQVWQQVMSYECAKASAGLKLSFKIFQKNNGRVSDEWNEIKRSLGFDSIASRIVGAAGDRQVSIGS